MLHTRQIIWLEELTNSWLVFVLDCFPDSVLFFVIVILKA